MNHFLFLNSPGIDRAHSYKNNIAEKVTMQSFYMAYGGTNWGHSAAPVVYTSYDYS